MLKKLLIYLTSKTKFFSFCVRLNLFYLLASIAILISIKFQAKSKYTVLCLGRPIFNDDINSLFKFSGLINYHIIPKEFFTSIFNFFLKGMLRPRIHPEYYSIVGFEDQKVEYREFLEKVFDKLLNKINFDAVLSANYVYAWQQEIASLCVNRSIPFIILHKEGMTSKDNYLAHSKSYTNNFFIGSKILVYNNNMKTALIESEIQNLNKNNIEIVGVPRFDSYFSYRGNIGKNITFFSFMIEDKLRSYDLSLKKIQEFQYQADKFHLEVMKIALQNRENKLIIKTKSTERYLDYVKTLANNNNFNNIDNLIITETGDTSELIRESFCVLGFNSSVLIEALILERKIITPAFDESIVDGYFDDYPELVNYANTFEDINAHLSDTNEKSLNQNSRKAFLEEYIYKTDGKASTLAEEKIINTIKIGTEGC